MKRLLSGLAAAGLLALSVAYPAHAEDAKGATVKGQVVWAGGAVPKRMTININQDKAFCTKCEPNGAVLSEEYVIDAKSKGVANVAVWLQPVAGGTLPAHPDMKAIQGKTVVLDQPCCSFVPRVTLLVEGQTLEARNSSEVPHNTNIVSPAPNPSMNPAIPPGKSVMVPGWKGNGKVSSVSCGIHPWMKGYIWTLPHPYFALTDKDGNFEIKDAPVGKFRIVYWHETAGWVTGDKTGSPIEVMASGTDVGKIKLAPPKDD